MQIPALLPFIGLRGRNLLEYLLALMLEGLNDRLALGVIVCVELLHLRPLLGLDGLKRSILLGLELIEPLLQIPSLLGEWREDLLALGSQFVVEPVDLGLPLRVQVLQRFALTMIEPLGVDSSTVSPLTMP